MDYVEQYTTAKESETVNWSNMNSHEIDINSESIQLNKLIVTGLPQFLLRKKQM